MKYPAIVSLIITNALFKSIALGTELGNSLLADLREVRGCSKKWVVTDYLISSVIDGLTQHFTVLRTFKVVANRWIFPNYEASYVF